MSSLCHLVFAFVLRWWYSDIVLYPDEWRPFCIECCRWFRKSRYFVDLNHGSLVFMRRYKLQQNANSSRFVYWKCRKHGECPLKNDDFVLKNGRLFCNLRYECESPDPGAQVSYTKRMYFALQMMKVALQMMIFSWSTGWRLQSGRPQRVQAMIRMRLSTYSVLYSHTRPSHLHAWFHVSDSSPSRTTVLSTYVHVVYI